MLSIDAVQQAFEEALREHKSFDRAFSKAMFVAYTAGLEEDAAYVACDGSTYIKQEGVNGGERTKP